MSARRSPLGGHALPALPPRLADQIVAANLRRHNEAQAGRGQAVSEDPQAKANADAGRAAKAAGDSAERLVEAANRYYLANGRAHLKKQHPEVAVLGGIESDVFRAKFIGEAPVDYLGSVAGGRGVHLEVKSSGTTNLPLQGARGPTLKPGQARDLASAHALGAFSAVLVCVQAPRPRGRKGAVPPGRRWYLLRWPGWLAAVEAARAEDSKSLSHENLGRHGVVCPDTHGWPDWLAVLEAM